MSRVELPAEIWNAIFDLAADEDVIFQPHLPTAFAECTWYKTIFGSWTLRTCQDAVDLLQRRSYMTKKSIIATCKSWQRVGSEFLFRCLFIDRPTRLPAICAMLDKNSSLGWWTRRIHITHSTERQVLLDDFEVALISIIRQCPNLEIFIVDRPMESAFGPVADSLCTYASMYLKTVHWNVPSTALSKVIWALDSLPSLLVLHIEFQPDQDPTSKDGTPRLGAAGSIHLTLPHLAQLSLRGSFQDFLEQAIEWSLPSLQCLSLHNESLQWDRPDYTEFLAQHGAGLTFLNLNVGPSHDVPKILDLCPLLKTFTFDADWRLPTTSNAGAETPAGTAIVNRPHQHITHIGLHGLSCAFGVGYLPISDPIRAGLIRLNNDLNFAVLTKANFPKLKCVRVLNRFLLSALEQADGPTEEDGCLERWERWWAQCARMGVRLEDCTGAELGTLPQNSEDSEDEESEGEGNDEDEDDEEGDGDNQPPVEGSMADLRILLEECRQMSKDREEPRFGPGLWM